MIPSSYNEVSCTADIKGVTLLSHEWSGEALTSWRNMTKLILLLRHKYKTDICDCIQKKKYGAKYKNLTFA